MVGVQLQVPPASAVVVQISCPFSRTATVAFGSAVPLMIGCALFTAARGAGTRMLGVLMVLRSIVNVLEPGVLTLPAASVALTSIVCAPAVSGVRAAQFQLPLASAVAVQIGCPCSLTVTLLPASAVPANIGVVVLIAPALGGLLTTGAAGACVSICNTTGAESAPILPAASVALAVIVYVPLLNGVLGVQIQSPFWSVVAVQSVLPPSFTLTWLPASAVPVKAGVVSLVALPLAGLLMLGAAGAAKSIVKLTGADTLPVLPAGSIAVAVSVWLPAFSGVEGVQLQSPFASARVVQICMLPSFTITVLPASAVPLISGFELLIEALAAGAVMLGAAGTVVSTIKLREAEALPVLPAISVAVAVIEWFPSFNPVVGEQLHVLPALVVAVQSVVLPSLTMTVLPVSAAPLIIGWPVATIAPDAGLVIPGAAGAVVSIVKLLVAVLLVVPAVLVAETVSVWLPSARAAGVQFHSPIGPVAAVQSSIAPS